MLWGRKSVKAPVRERMDPDKLVESLGGEEETARLERELSEYSRKGVTVEMRTDDDGRRILVPIEVVAVEKKDRKSRTKS